MHRKKLAIILTKAKSGNITQICSKIVSDFTCRCFSVADRDAKVFASKDPVPVKNKRTHKHPMVLTFNYEFTNQSMTSPYAAVSWDVTKRTSAGFFSLRRGDGVGALRDISEKTAARRLGRG